MFETPKQVLQKSVALTGWIYNGSLDVGFTEQLKLIRRLQGSYPVKLLCEQFGVCRSSYKYWRSHRRVIGPDKVKPRELVNEKHELSNGSAGSRSIVAMVSQDGIELSRDGPGASWKS
jgi:putative transposase